MMAESGLQSGEECWGGHRYPDKMDVFILNFYCDTISVSDPGSKKSAKIMEKFQQKSTKIIRISYIFFKTIKLMFIDINIYSMNNKTKQIIFRRNVFFFIEKS